MSTVAPPPELTAEWQALALRLAGRYRHRAFSREDLQQEALLACLVALRRHDPARHGHLGPYLNLSIRSHLFHLVARAGRQTLSYLAREPLDPDPPPDERAAAAEVLQYAQAILPAREAFVLAAAADGRDDASVAAELGCPYPSVCQSRCRALSRLRKEFNG